MEGQETLKMEMALDDLIAQRTASRVQRREDSHRKGADLGVINNFKKRSTAAKHATRHTNLDFSCDQEAGPRAYGAERAEMIQRNPARRIQHNEKLEFDLANKVTTKREEDHVIIRICEKPYVRIDDRGNIQLIRNHYCSLLTFTVMQRALRAVNATMIFHGPIRDGNWEIKFVDNTYASKKFENEILHIIADDGLQTFHVAKKVYKTMNGRDMDIRETRQTAMTIKRESNVNIENSEMVPLNVCLNLVKSIVTAFTGNNTTQ